MATTRRVIFFFQDSSLNGGSAVGLMIDPYPVDLFRAGARRCLGITVSGVVGSRQRIDYADTVTGSITNWQTLTNVTLTNASITVIDFSAPPNSRRFYRSAVVL